jgi:hypothetical protein
MSNSNNITGDNLLHNKRIKDEIFEDNKQKIIKKKIIFPITGEDNNYIGLILGPKGSYLKNIEKQSNCKIYIRGKGTHLSIKEDPEPSHAVLIGNNEHNIMIASNLIERILFADETLKNKIKDEQKIASQILSNNQVEVSSFEKECEINNEFQNELHNISPYGKPSPNSNVMTIPNEAVGLLIGKSGDTIKKLIKDTCCKIFIAMKEIPNSNLRNIFIEGENYLEAKKQIEEIVIHHEKLKLNQNFIGESNPNPGPYVLLIIPDEYSGIVVGKNGDTIKSISEKADCGIFIPNKNRHYYEEMLKALKILGNGQSITFTGKPLFQELIENYKNKSFEKETIIKETQSKYNNLLTEMDNESSYHPNKYNKAFTYNKQEIYSMCNITNIKEIKSVNKISANVRIIELNGKVKNINCCIDKIQEIITKHEEKTLGINKTNVSCLNYPSLSITNETQKKENIPNNFAQNRINTFNTYPLNNYNHVFNQVNRFPLPIPNIIPSQFNYNNNKIIPNNNNKNTVIPIIPFPHMFPINYQQYQLANLYRNAVFNKNEKKK